jgi:hypothetical protein
MGRLSGYFRLFKLAPASLEFLATFFGANRKFDGGEIRSAVWFASYCRFVHPTFLSRGTAGIHSSALSVAGQFFLT